MEPIPDKENKMIDGSTPMVQPITVKAVSVLTSEYFYPESGGYKAITVIAATKTDADAIYREKRQPIAQPTEEKVDDSKQTPNE